MRLSEIGELSLLEKIRGRFGSASRGIVIGIGDDAAVINPSGKKLLLTTDIMVEGVHFDRAFITPWQLGFKIVSVNVSDIYAMGGDPRFLLLDIAAKKDTEERFIESFFDGIQRALDFYALALIGGDLSASKSDMIISATLVGYAGKPLLRSGARPGDRIYVTGDLGDSACGLELLKIIRKKVPVEFAVHRKGEVPRRVGSERSMESGKTAERLHSQHAERNDLSSVISEISRLGIEWDDAEPLLRRHLMPEARNPRKFLSRATSMIDLSDGLYIDLSRVCEESGVGARIYLGKVPMSLQMRTTAAALGLEPYRLATSGGEDYELLFTAPPNRRIALPSIGEITVSERVVVDIDGRESRFTAKGYRHWD